ncbi:MAG TPA: hypothetical protein PKW80_03060 [Bacteroidales bacterium]|nr:hypothetical protein [Bacteroidales bacterium]
MTDAINKKVTRPPGFLYLLCFLSVISNVISVIVSVILLSGSKAGCFLNSLPVIDIMAEELKHGSVLCHLLKIGLHLLCIFAVVLMGKRLKKGFVLYVCCQLALLAIPWIFLLQLGTGYLLMSTSISLIFALFFIMLFSLYLPDNKTGKAEIIS